MSPTSPSAFKQLEPIPQFRATAKLAGFLEHTLPSSNITNDWLRGVEP
jgi:hypothetical protein